jgi:hypothetical protein
MNWHLSRRRLACLFCVVAFCVLFVWFLLLVLSWFVCGDFVTAWSKSTMLFSATLLVGCLFLRLP